MIVFAPLPATHTFQLFESLMNLLMLLFCRKENFEAVELPKKKNVLFMDPLNLAVAFFFATLSFKRFFGSVFFHQ